MALKYYFTGHNYNTATVATFVSQYNTQSDTASALDPRTVGGGRFPNTAAVLMGSTGGTSTAHATILTRPFNLYSNSIVRVAMDILLPLDFDVSNYTRWIVGFTNGNFQYGTNLNADVLTATQQADQYCSIYQTVNGKLALRSTTNLLASGTTVLMAGIYYRLEIEANLQVSGSFKLWINDQLDIDYSGDVTSGQTSGAYRVRFGDTYVQNSTTIVWDDEGTGFSGYLGDFEPIQILPDGPGSSTQGTPVGTANNWQAVDETFRNGTTDYVLLNTATTQKDLYSYSNVTVTGNVISVTTIPAAWLDTTGLAKISFETLSNGNTGNSSISSVIGGTTSTVYGTAIEPLEIPVDPATGNAWTINAVNNAQFGVSAKT